MFRRAFIATLLLILLLNTSSAGNDQIYCGEIIIFIEFFFFGSLNRSNRLLRMRNSLHGSVCSLYIFIFRRYVRWLLLSMFTSILRSNSVKSLAAIILHGSLINVFKVLTWNLLCLF